MERLFRWAPVLPKCGSFVGKAKKVAKGGSHGGESASFQELKPVRDGDRLVVPAPWERAEALQEHLRSHGIESTLCLEPTFKEARLELRTDLGTEAVQALLDQWER